MSYGVIEIIYSLYYYISYKESIWIFEHTGKTIQFDPIRGYTLTRIPSRFARITYGEIEYIGTFEGNAQGFPDRDDFTIKRPTRSTRRFAVFGDSFTAGQYLYRNWPDRVEDFFLAKGEYVELLNFSIDGGGLANWVSIIQEILSRKPYELDGLIFAVYRGNLHRKFSFSDHRNRKKHAFARVSSWRSDSRPRSLSEAKKLLDDSEIANSFIVSTKEFNEILKGKKVSSRQWKFKLLTLIKRKIYLIKKNINRILETDTHVSDIHGNLSPEQLILIDKIERFSSQNRLPIIVVYIWSRDGLLKKSNNRDFLSLENTRVFAERIGGTFVDGRGAFDGVGQEQLKKLWLPYDGHWAQGGSDVFAEFMMERIDEVVPENRTGY